MEANTHYFFMWGEEVHLTTPPPYIHAHTHTLGRVLSYPTLQILDGDVSNYVGGKGEELLCHVAKMPSMGDQFRKDTVQACDSWVTDARV
jgi:hypothetical protein